MELTDDQGCRLRRFATLVAASPHNLVSRGARAELWERHVLESVAVAAALPTGIERLLDVGSGGGFPGVVVAVMRPELEVHLLDSTAKKTRFLQECAQQLDLPTVIHTGRAEDLVRSELGGSFDVVTARAVAPLERLVGWTVPFLRPGGLVYAVKGERWEQELRAARPAMVAAGVRVVATPQDLAVPGTASAEPVPRVVILGR